jgi:hypothetical protein
VGPAVKAARRAHQVERAIQASIIGMPSPGGGLALTALFDAIVMNRPELGTGGGYRAVGSTDVTKGAV